MKTAHDSFTALLLMPLAALHAGRNLPGVPGLEYAACAPSNDWTTTGNGLQCMELSNQL